MRKSHFKVIFLLSFIFLADELTAQDRYAIYFKYKPQDTFSLLRPQEFLSSKALDRREREEIQADSMDLPISSKYLAEVKSKVNQILYETKWFNALIVVGDAQNMEEIKKMPFVSKIELVAPGFFKTTNGRVDPTNLTSKNETKFNTIHTRQVATQTTYDFQNELIGIPEMHAAGYRGKGITIAIFDAGFPGANLASSLLHLQVNKQIIGTRDFVRPWNKNIYSGHEHGTNVLSLVASDEPTKMVGGAPDASIILVITEDASTEYRIEEFNWVRGAEYVDSLGADIINSSLGYLDFDDPEMNYSHKSLDGKSAVVTRGAGFAAQRGILVVNSVGNYGSKEGSLVAPADAFGILAVGSVNKDLNISSFSSRGPTSDLRLKPDLVAMGNGVSLIRSTGSVGISSGTSFSAPQVTALAAGLWGANREWKKDKLIQNIVRSATKAINPDNEMGFGIPDFATAHYGETLSFEAKGEPNNWKMYPNPLFGQDLFFEFGEGLEVQFSLIDLSGRTIYDVLLQRNSSLDTYQINLRGVGQGLYLVQLDDGKKILRRKISIW